MTNHTDLWFEYAGDAIDKELQTWQISMTRICEKTNNEARYSSEEAPWLRQLAWLNFALNGAMLVPKLSLPAYVTLTVTDLIADNMQQQYKDGAQLSRALLSQHYNGVLDSYINQINQIERTFATHSSTRMIAAAMKKKLWNLVLSPAGTWIRDDSVDAKGKLDKQIATEHLRNIIAHAEVLPTEHKFLRTEFVERGFGAFYDAIYAIVIRSNLVPKEQRLPGAIYQRYQGQPITGLSGQLQEICIKSKLHIAIEKVRYCDLSFKAIQIESKPDTLTILNELWRFDFELESAQALVKIPAGWYWAPVKHVHLRQRKSPRKFRAHTHASVPEIQLALDRGLRKYASRAQRLVA